MREVYKTYKSNGKILLMFGGGGKVSGLSRETLRFSFSSNHDEKNRKILKNVNRNYNLCY